MPATMLEAVVMSIDLRERVSVNEGGELTHPRSQADQSVARVLEIGRRHGGKGLPAPGHTMLIRFPSPDEAVRAACDINALFTTSLAMGQEQIIYRIGMHFGGLPLDAGSVEAPVLDDAVQVSAHATRKQILLTEAVADHLSPVFRQMVFEVPERLESGGQNGALYELVCRQDDFGSLVDTRDNLTLTGGALRLTYQERDWRVSAQNNAIIAGRSPQSDIIVEGHVVSRFHARFEYRQGKFVLVDQSRNGSHVQFQNGREAFLKHQELDLWGSGTVFLGERGVGPEGQIHFACEA